MKHTATGRRILPLLLTGLAGAPLAGSLAPSSAWAAGGPQTFKGPTVSADHGPVQVSITVKNKRIVGVKTVTSPEEPRSQFIQGKAIPVLKQETLKAQSARINEVSGASDTSGAYISSLQAAVKKARQTKALR